MSTLINLKNITCKEYCKIKGCNYKVIESQKDQKIYIPNYNGKAKGEYYIQSEYPEIYIAELKDVLVVSNSYAICDEEGYCIYDQVVNYNNDKYHFDWGNVKNITKDSTNVNKIYSGVEFNKAIMLLGNFTENYYHFNLEVISRLLLLNTMDEYKDIPLILNAEIKSYPQLLEELELVNKGKREIFYLYPGWAYKVKELVYLSQLVIIPPSLKLNTRYEYGDLIVSDLCIDILKDNLALKNSNLNRKIFISRIKSANTRLYNEESVSKLFESYGYEIIDPRDYSFREQLEIFSQAKVIAGVSGAGLTNIIFANRNTKVICILPSEIKVSCYSTIAGILNQPYYFIDADLDNKVIKREYSQKPFTVDENILKGLLDKYNL